MNSANIKSPKYPNISVRLVGEDGNAFAILRRVQRELRRGGVPQTEVSEFLKEAMKGDYNNLLRTVMEWVSTDNDEC